MENKTYKDPKRKIGSQSEIPNIIFKNDKIIVGGYQQFVINKKTLNIKYIKKKGKVHFYQ